MEVGFMKLKSIGGITHYRGLLTTAAAAFALALVVYGAAARGDVPVNCQGLHAGIRAQVVGSGQGFTESPHASLSFVLLNDSDAPIESDAGSWTLIVDGSALKDSGMIFGNGPTPAGG